MTILIVDDEKEIADLVEVIVKSEGYEPLTFYDPLEAWQEIQRNPAIDLAILDVMMPGLDGFELCARIRQEHTYPILMLTARGEDVDKINGLTTGADDYITKPFNPLELLARIKAHLRRYTSYNAKESGSVYAVNGLRIDQKQHTVTLYDEPISLTPTEFDIVWLLCENKGNVVSSEEIFERVWKEKYLDSNNTVMVHIRRIREKLHEPSRNPRYIKTVWGVGYKIET